MLADPANGDNGVLQRSGPSGSPSLSSTVQDFKAAFGVGENDVGITTIDADGVALAAIQGLNQKLEQQLKEKEGRIEALERTVAELKQVVARLASVQDDSPR